ncbi:hypothetical protein CHELA1G11_11834 [Hyphomicrobiales bacterium]|nr:hypothetical protein CHELA1G11_11834 [Hyphomicrobiales bacterium]CAH1665127.1 hypothetical protein CHELA1G2_12474 [Hyphomicrobiales bacterium]
MFSRLYNYRYIISWRSYLTAIHLDMCDGPEALRVGPAMIRWSGGARIRPQSLATKGAKKSR